jgi:hypothetical protein
MHRRNFLKVSATAAGLGAIGFKAFGATADSASPETDALVRELVRANDASIPGQLAAQERRAGHRWLGGLPNDLGIHGARNTAGLVGSLACAVRSPDSNYFRSAELAEPLRLAAAYLLAAQHDDGTTDLPETNFHSPPDTAFCLETLIPAYTLLKGSSQPALDPVMRDLARFIVKAGDALTTGGVHTPNHRWVVCGGLASIHSLFPNPKLLARIDQWLAEGIDLDPDGQFTEKSTSVYSPVVDRALITVARLLDRPALFEPVRRNLEMTLYYVHPDGEVVTEASRRQDRYQRGSMARYYYSYRFLALRDGDGRFAAMARQIERHARPQLTGELAAFLTEPELKRPLPADAALPTDYAKVFSYSNLARIRRGAISGTVLAANTTLFSFRKGNAALEAVRLASAFFGKGQFASDDLIVRDGRYVLRQKLEGPYYQPFSAEQIASGEHVRMAPNGTLAADSRAARAQSNVQHYEALVEVTESNGKFTLAISIAGTADVPVALELAFRHGGKLEGVEPVAGLKDAYLLAQGTGRYSVGGDTIEFGPGHTEHRYTQVRGALPKWDGQSVYLTGFTPFNLTLAIS